MQQRSAQLSHLFSLSVVDENFPDGTVEAASNYCRNPAGYDDGEWCYAGSFGSLTLCSIPCPGKRTCSNYYPKNKSKIAE